MPRCSYRHLDFRSSLLVWQPDETDHCWVNEVGNFGTEDKPEYYCLFHAPVDKEPIDREDWKLDERGDQQTKLLKKQLALWNIENEKRAKKGIEPLEFILRDMQCGNLVLHNATIIGSVNFNGAIFSGDVWFDNVEFNGFTRFNSTNFQSNLLVNWTRFNQKASFCNAKIDFSSFSYTNFSMASFGNTTFSGITSFNETVFRFEAIFNNVKFCSSATFECAKFHKLTEFNKAEFQDIKFINTDFMSITNFSDSTFNRSPEFHEAKLHQGTVFTGAIFKDSTSEKAAQAYRTLKLAMENVRSRQEEAMFYALEQKSLRQRPDTPRTTKFLSFLYEIVSDYGRSIWMPAAWLGVVSVYFSGFYYGWREVYECKSTLAWFTVEQIIKPFGIDKYDCLKDATTLPASELSSIKAIAGLHSIIALTLIALLLLPIRWNYKRG